MREWLRDNSSIWSKFDPRPTYRCENCGGGGATPEPVKVHRIGYVSRKGRISQLYCDGSEL